MIINPLIHIRPDDNKKMLEEMQAKRRSFSNPVIITVISVVNIL